MSNDDYFPPVSKALIEELERRFPDRMPAVLLSLEDIRIKQGELNVIRFLRNRYEEQAGIAKELV